MLPIDIWRYIIVPFLDYCARINLANICWLFRDELYICVADYLDWRECYAPDHITHSRLLRENKNFISYLIDNYFYDWTPAGCCSYMPEFCLYLVHSFHNKNMMNRVARKFNGTVSLICEKYYTSNHGDYTKTKINDIINNHYENYENDPIINIGIDLLLQNNGMLNTAILANIKLREKSDWHDTLLLYLDINHLKDLQADRCKIYIFLYHRDETIIDHVFSLLGIFHQIIYKFLSPMYNNINTPRILKNRIEKCILPHINQQN